MFKRLWSIYKDGFGNLPRWGKLLITIVLIKLFVMFVVFKLFLMPNYLNQYTTDQEKSNHVLNELITNP